jgi:CheY-like chemotaxis protein
MADHHGRITCESQLGVGTSFEIELPVATLPLTAARPVRQTLPPWQSGSETVLLIDDEPLVRRAASAMLAYGGYSVVEAEDGRQAIEIYQHRRHEIDLVVLDRSMPGLPGEQVAMRLREINQALPIVLLSGHAGPAPAPAGAYASAALSKPVDANTLLRTIREVIDQHRSA